MAKWEVRVGALEGNHWLQVTVYEGDDVFEAVAFYVDAQAAVGQLLGPDAPYTSELFKDSASIYLWASPGARALLYPQIHA